MATPSVLARRPLGALLIAAMLAVVSAGIPLAASAQPVSLADTPMEVQLFPGAEPGYTLFIVTVHIPEDVALPALVRMPFPEGSSLLWAGEILGGPITDDPERSSVIIDVSGGSALEVTAESTRTVQYEAVGPPLTVVDGLTTAVFEWIQTVPVGEVSFSVRLPATAEVVQIDPEAPGPPVRNAQGESLYTLRPVILSEGQTFTVTAAYGRERAGDAGTNGGPSLLILLLGALGVALVALGVALYSQRRRSGERAVE